MAKLVSMKTTKAERQKMYEPAKMAEDAPIYPWGLTVNLDDSAIEKLGSGNVPMEVGTEVLVLAKAKVVASEDRQTEGDAHRRSVTLQITDLCLEDGSGGDDVASKLYGGGKAT